MTVKARTQAVIQARMASTRLPGKVLEKIGEKTILGWVAERLRSAELVDRVVVATSVSAADDAVEEFAAARRIPLFRGSEEDVLDRFHGAVLDYPAETIVRATADNPLLDSAFLDDMIRSHMEAGAGYTGAAGPVPLGSAAEILSASALEKAWREARDAASREHVTPYIYSNPAFFRLNRTTPPAYLAGRSWRLTVDTAEDLEFLRQVHRALAGAPFDARSAAELLDRRPELLKINKDVEQKSWRGKP
ncbi:MAG: cytidylyltransferase domain-containing protein [Candidatus Nitrospinota bacterium M3_3B_026]